MFKTRKPVIASTLDEYAKDPKANIRNDCVILDAMAILHSISHIPETWGGLADQIFNKVIKSYLSGSKRVDFVADVNKPNSIKDGECSKHLSDSGLIHVKISGKDQKTPTNMQSWNIFLTS